MNKSLTLNHRSQELANTLTHAAGIVLALVGVPLLLRWAVERGAGWTQLLGLGIFGFALLAVYTSSTIYHLVPPGQWKHLMRRIDHIAIYFLIAGTHTPFLVYYLNNGTGLFYLGILWGMVALGVLYKCFLFDRMEWLSVIFYLGMGWMAIFTLPPMTHVMSETCLWWVVAGGLFYTAGVLFYVWKRLPYHHAIWHMFGLGGSTAHFMAVWSIVVNG